MVAHALCYMIGLCDALELLHTWRKATLNTEASLNKALAGHYVKGLRLWSVKHDSNAAAESYRIGIKMYTREHLCCIFACGSSECCHHINTLCDTEAAIVVSDSRSTDVA
eukprot:2145-Heterococcus_DN1.PRE.2